MATQIVIAKLKSSNHKDEFIALTRTMVNWLEKQPGFISYALYEDGLHISDILTYESEEAAERIIQDFRNTKTYSKLIPLIDSEYSSFLGKPVPIK